VQFIFLRGALRPDDKMYHPRSVRYVMLSEAKHLCTPRARPFALLRVTPYHRAYSLHFIIEDTCPPDRVPGLAPARSLLDAKNAYLFPLRITSINLSSM